MFSKLKSKLSIYTKLRLILVRVLVTSFALLFILLTLQNVYKAFQNEREQVQVIAEIIAVNVGESLLFDDGLNAQQTMNTLSLSPSRIQYAVLLNNDREIVASFGSEVKTELKIWESIEHKQSILFNNEEVGQLHIVVSLSKMWASILAHLVTLVFVLSGTLMLATFLIRGFAETIVEPIKMLAETSRIITRTARYRIRTEKVSDDEIGQLTDTVNEMLDLIETRDGELRIAATAFNTQEAIVITDADKNIIRVNPAYTLITGYKLENVQGKRPLVLQSNEQNGDVYKEIDAEVIKSGFWQGELIDFHRTGYRYPGSFMITVVKNSGGAISNYVMTFTDISERVAAEDRIRHLAFYDPLTELPNRRLLIERLKQALEVSDRHQFYGALFFLDLDKFKVLNDSKGHHFGDMLLIEVAKRLSNIVRAEDTVARLGGDEFVVMIERLAQDEAAAMTEANAVGNKIVFALNEPYELNDFIYELSSSVGVTLFHDTENDMETILSQADTAMYAAKTAGRNTLRFFGEELQEAMKKRILDEQALSQALEEEQFELHYQVQIDKKGDAEGAEALIRWHHPSKGLVYPDNFIPLAEETQLINEIGIWVLRTACQQLNQWRNDSVAKNIVISINISVLQFQKDDFVSELLQIVKEYGINPTMLKIELTETVVLQNVNLAIEKMNQLKEKGITVAMDDFGTGYSSLNYISRLPVDQIKIDRSFVSRATNSEHDVLIIKMVIALGEMLNINVVAEGIETLSQFKLLQDMGCKHFQGYYFGKPMPITAFNALLQQDILSSSSDPERSINKSTALEINY